MTVNMDPGEGRRVEHDASGPAGLRKSNNAGAAPDCSDAVGVCRKIRVDRMAPGAKGQDPNTEKLQGRRDNAPTLKMTPI